MVSHTRTTRRDVLLSLASAALIGQPRQLPEPNDQFRPWSLTSFSADVTIPPGHPCMGGGIAPARTIVDPLEAIGFVLKGGTLPAPVVVMAIDWCEIRNDAYDRWREVLAQSAGTDPQHVMVAAVHQHDAPISDIKAQRLLEQSH